MKRLAALLLIVLSLSIVILPVQASTVIPRYTFIDSIYVNLEIDTQLKIASCEGEVTAKGIYPVKVLVDLQRYEDGRWKTIKSWSNENSWCAYAAGDFLISRGYNYRVYVRGYVYDENGYAIEAASITESEGFY